MRASARWTIALSGRRASSRVPDIQGGRTVADPGEGARQTILPIGAERLQFRRDAVMPRRFVPPLKLGQQIGKRPLASPLAGSAEMAARKLVSAAVPARNP